MIWLFIPNDVPSFRGLFCNIVFSQLVKRNKNCTMIYLHWRISKWLDVDLTMQKSLHNLSSHLNILGGIKEKINKLNIHDECSWKAIEMTRNRSSYSSLNILLYVLFIYIWYEYIMVQNIWRSQITQFYYQLLPTMELNVLEFGPGALNYCSLDPF